MAAGPWLFTNASIDYMLDGTIVPGADTFKMALFLSTSDLGAGSTDFASVTNEHAAQFDYVAGGIAITLVLTGTTTVKVDIDTDPVWTANGGSILAKLACIYEVGQNVLCYCLLESGGANVEATDGNTLTVAAHGDGVFDATTA